jgi:hypothetical protein
LGARTRRCVSLMCIALGIAPPVFAAEALDPAAQAVAPTAFNREPPQPKLSWGTGDGKSYWVPAADIFGFDFLLNRFDNAFVDDTDYDVGPSSWRRNLRGSWVYDNDPFAINQFAHPYQGSMYHGFARSAGQDYWHSLAYTMAGSAFWELFGETTPPSINDQFTTGFAGSFLGEALFRMASLTLESSDGRPGFWREVGAAIISPSTGFNRWAYGDRFDGVFRSHDPAVHTAASLGANLNATVKSNVNLNRTGEGEAIPQEFQRGEATLDFNLAYGLPGKPGYTYDRPFDYFALQFTGATANALENLIVRGMLAGRPYEVGDHYRGIWGLYANYDYIAPQLFRVSATSMSLGTTGQWWLTRNVALQGTTLAGVGYGSAGVIRAHGERDYHNGLTPTGLAALRLIVSDRVLLEFTGREYFVSDIASDEKNGSENIVRGDLALTVRVKRLHGISLKYVVTHRDASYTDQPDTRQTLGAIAIAYTYLGHPRFGAVDWRPDAVEHQEENY